MGSGGSGEDGGGGGAVWWVGSLSKVFFLSFFKRNTWFLAGVSCGVRGCGEGFGIRWVVVEWDRVG